MSLESGEAEREVFISYRRLDNDPPPDCPADRGFVDYLLRQVRYDLTQLGVTNLIVWQDRSKIAPADDFTDEISSALNNADLFIAIVSKNYIASTWCAKELDMMTARIRVLGAPAEEHRIFRVDKHKVLDDEVPDPLRRIESVRFYREDRYADRVDDYFWRGKVVFIDEYEGAVKKLAVGISNRLDALGIAMRKPKADPEPPPDNAPASNGRVVFVATPAGDMARYYQPLVRELRGAGYRVTPDPDKDLGKLGEEVRSTIISALAEAEASIHLLGTRTGGRPDGLDMDLVPMQLAAAAEQAKSKAGFERIIWAPKVLPSGTSGEPEVAGRDPLEILGRFGQRLLATDQIEGDTASRFNQFVLQHFAKMRSDPDPGKVERKIVYIRAPAPSRTFAVKIAKELKQAGFEPIEFARAEQGQGHHIVVCWGSQSKAKIEDEIRTIHDARKTSQSAGGKLILLLTSPATKAKADVLDLQMPYVDHIVDARQCDDAAAVGKKLASALGRSYGLLGGTGWF
jgi:hypothetical protein